MILYLIKVVFCSALLLGAYHFLSEKEKNHQFKRFALLAFLALSFIIPLITFEMNVETDEVTPLAQFQAQQAISFDHTATAATRTFDLFYLLYLGYGIVSAYYAVKFLTNLRLIILQVKRHEKIHFDDYTIVLLPVPTAPHSFLNYIFLSKADYYSHSIANEILIHEQAHIQQLHSLDILFIEFLRIFSWCNPFLPLYKKAIQTNHEFLADEHVIKICDNIINYQRLLLLNASQQSSISLSSPFNYLTTKKRLIMMTSNPSKKLAILKHLLLALILVSATFLFSSRTIAQIKANKPAQPLQTSGEGVSEAEMKTYKEIENKYIKLSANGKYKVIVGTISEEEKTTLKKIFVRMSANQQENTTIAFIKPGKPFSPIVPTSQQLALFKKPNIFGVWLDGKHVANGVLDEYKPSDFKHVFISKLYGKAKEGRNYTHQADLMTAKYYDNYLAKSMARKDELLMVSWNGPFGKSNSKLSPQNK